MLKQRVPYGVYLTITLSRIHFTREITKRSSYTAVFYINFHGRACARENGPFCVFELLTDNTEHSEAIKTGTKTCVRTEGTITLVVDRSTLEFQHTAESRQKRLNLNIKPHCVP